MRTVLTAVLLALVLTTPWSPSDAEVDPGSVVPTSSAFELVVIEADGCMYCGFFRRDVLPAYKISRQGQEAPVRFIDVNDIESAQVDLTSPVDTVPTFVVLKSHHEVGRISGYVGREDFFHSINYLLASAP
jgi:thioredoxin-related protein